MDGEPMKTLIVGENITKTNLLKRWSKDTKQKVWDNEDKKWKHITLKNRIKDTKFEITTVEERGNGVVLHRLEGKTQKMHWVEFQQGTKSKPVWTIMTPHIMSLDVGKPKEAIEQIVEEVIAPESEESDSSTLKENENLK